MPKGDRKLYEQLIAAVRPRELLYNTTLPGHKDRSLFEKTWVQVATATGLTVADARRTWATLRSSYLRSLHNEMLSSEPGASKRARWYLSEQMSFLQPYLYYGQNTGITGQCAHDMHLETEGHFGVSFELTPKEEILEEDESSIKSYSSFSSQANDVSQEPVPLKKLKYNSTAALEKIMQHEASPRPTSSKPDAEDDADLLFFKALLPTFKELNRKRQRKVKIEMMKLVYDAIEQQEDEDKEEISTEIVQREMM